MTGKDLLKSMDYIDMQYITEAENADSIDAQYAKEAENRNSINMQYTKETKRIAPTNTKNARRLKKRRKKWAAAAVCLAVLSAFGSTALANQFGLGIQDWFTGRWAESTGADMSEGQSQTIASLSQYIGKSSTDGDICVTVDSYTSGRHLSWMLINITGFPFAEDTKYYFQHWKIKINARECGGSIQQIGVNEAGAYQILFRHSGPSGLNLIDPPDLYDGDTWEITLALTDLKAYANEEATLIQKGNWNISFETSNTNKAPVIKLDDIQVDGCYLSDQKKITVPVTDIELSETGISYCYSYQLEDPSKSYSDDRVMLPEPVLLFKNGSELSEPREYSSGKAATDANGTVQAEEELAWPAPVNLEEVSGVRFGDEVILLPKEIK